MVIVLKIKEIRYAVLGPLTTWYIVLVPYVFMFVTLDSLAALFALVWP